MAKDSSGPAGPTAADISKVMSALGARGGANSRKNLSPAKKKALARKAAGARWAKKAKAAK